MSHFEIFGSYLVGNLVLLMVLTVAVIRFRFTNNVSLGDGGDGALSQRIRAHGNFVEFAPLHLIAMLSMMQLGTSSLMLHVVGAAFLVGRVLHGWGITRPDASNLARQLGTILTLLSFLIAIVYLIVLIVSSRGSYGIG